jgi:hypothetical protein
MLQREKPFILIARPFVEFRRGIVSLLLAIEYAKQYKLLSLSECPFPNTLHLFSKAFRFICSACSMAASASNSASASTSKRSDRWDGCVEPVTPSKMICIADPATGSHNHSGNDSTLPGDVDAHIPFMIEDDRTDAEEPSGTELLENTSSSPAPVDPDVSSISSIILSHLSDIRGRSERNRHPLKVFEPKSGNGR